MQKTTQVLWLRNDLRLHDHEGFRLAVEHGAPLAVIYILPEHWLNTDDDGMSRLGSAKAHFLRASLIDLHRQLEDQTINFNMYHGHPVDIITRLRDELCGDIRLLTSDAQAPEEQEWLEAIKGYDIDLVTYESQTLFSRAQMDSLLNNFPASFSKFRKTVEKWSDRF
ncbi:MAG: deoxyribodipyrimidine photo-lyase, partial [Pseudomonadota bacterium]|nr:deoxyribodipyrimidine photo-lyase [Pseudomonadota bacterium]